MRKYISCLVLSMLLVSMMVSCKKEDPVHNAFEYELIKYEIDEGMIEVYGKLSPDASGYNLDVTLYSTGIVFDPIAEEFSGLGNIIILQKYSESSDELVSGTYNFDLSGNMDPFTFDIGRFGLFVNMDEQSGTIILANSGTIKVSKSDDNWTFVFDCMTMANKSITGTFTGNLDSYNKVTK